MRVFTIVLILIETINTSASVINNGVLHFLLIGDWGKGGNTGYVSNRIYDNDGVDDNVDDDNNVKHHELEQGDRLREGKKEKQNRELTKENVGTNQAAIAKAMGSYSDDFEPSFIIALGDNFYSNGVSSSTDSYWDYLWVNVYLDYYPSLRVSWYPVFGNHDYGYGAQGVQAQLDRTLIDEYWSFPATNYTKTFNIPKGGTVTVVFIDTTILAPSENKCCNEKGGISTELQTSRITNQLGHIDRMLNEANQSKPTWLLVAGHYPIHSRGEHGDTSELKNYLVPLLEKYDVHAYFCGHDHLSEHLIYNDVNYFVNGGGSMTDTIGGSSDAELLWAGEGYSAFASASATKTDLTISYLDSNRTVRYSHILTNPNYTPDNPVSVPNFLAHRVIFVSGALFVISAMIAVGYFLQTLTAGTYKRLSTKTSSSLRDSSPNLLSMNTLKTKSRIIKLPRSKKQNRTGIIALPYPPSEVAVFKTKELTINTLKSPRSISHVDEIYNNNQETTFHLENPMRSTLRSDRKVKHKINKTLSPQSYEVLTMKATPTRSIPQRFSR